MNPIQMLYFAVLILSPGGFWLGYVFLKHDAEWKMARARGGHAEPMATQAELEALRAEVRSLREELAGLRETSTSFDLSLEAALTQLQRRELNA
ncbi:hypothetical protein [Fimbriimonas ginsengisoli]|uniref:Phage shock protein B n=1 Tax=Fimbriimonas ginsengisoli Gsoil 348 TaxID=661478 RepID=A0A068NU39_FIMGI|nr:hypothetical protein [Fimbriimonas ginsengisoli]AIE85094.1 hypothetical protein OP10G_1726 [Fimbriimonas ginsengisoli Gsoil 348]